MSTLGTYNHVNSWYIQSCQLFLVHICQLLLHTRQVRYLHCRFFVFNFPRFVFFAGLGVEKGGGGGKCSILLFCFHVVKLRVTRVMYILHISFAFESSRLQMLNAFENVFQLSSATGALIFLNTIL